MKILYDIFPVLLFFIAYKFGDIYIATGVAIAASLLQMGILLAKKRFEVMPIITCVIIVVFGGLTIWLHNDIFIKWKPTLINLLFAMLFLGTQLFAKEPFIKNLMGAHVEMSEELWNTLSWMWISFFLLVGASNLFVAYHFSTDTWVNFKVFGLITLTILFVIIQTLFINRHAVFKE